MRYIILAMLLIPRLAWSQTSAYVVAPYGGFGCQSAQDLISMMDNLHNNPDTPLGKFLFPKVHSGECFSISEGQIALFNPRYQPYSRSQVGIFYTPSGRKFFCFIGSWRRAY
jgi:hypothetical protein